MEQANPKIQVEYSQDITIAIISDEKILQESDIQSLERSIMPLIEQSDSKRLLLNFSNVVFLTSSALGLLIRISKRINEGNGWLGLCCISPKILEIFKITRLDKIFDIYDTQIEAVESQL